MTQLVPSSNALSADARSESASVHGLLAGTLVDERELERSPPRSRQRGQHVVDHALEEVAERYVREVTLGLGRARDERPQPFGTRVLHAREPERRLPDARLSREHERGGPLRCSFDEGADGGELLVAADDLDRHRPPPAW